MPRIELRETWLSKKPKSQSFWISTLGILVIIAASFIYVENIEQAQSWMTATHESIFQKHELWRAWTTLFVHGDFKHLLSNLFLFSILGFFLAGYFSPWFFPGLAFLSGGVVNFFVLAGMSPQTQLIGVSGVVYWMGGAWLTLYLLLDRKRTWSKRWIRAGGLALALFLPSEAFDPQVSYQSHLFGFICGVILASLYFYLNKKMFRQAEVFEVMPDETDEFEI